MKRLAEFCDVSATALLMAAMLSAFYWLGLMHAQTKLRADCDGLNVVLLAKERYSCVSAPMPTKVGSEP